MWLSQLDTLLGPCIFKLESPLYNCTLSSAHNTSGTNILESEQIWVSYSVFVETCAHTLLRPNVWQYCTVEYCKCFYRERWPPSETCCSLSKIKRHTGHSMHKNNTENIDKQLHYYYFLQTLHSSKPVHRLLCLGWLPLYTFCFIFINISIGSIILHLFEKSCLIKMYFQEISMQIVIKRGRMK